MKIRNFVYRTRWALTLFMFCFLVACSGSVSKPLSKKTIESNDSPLRSPSSNPTTASVGTDSNRITSFEASGGASSSPRPSFSSSPSISPSPSPIVLGSNGTPLSPLAIPRCTIDVVEQMPQYTKAKVSLFGDIIELKVNSSRQSLPLPPENSITFEDSYLLGTVPRLRVINASVRSPDSTIGERTCSLSYTAPAPQPVVLPAVTKVSLEIAGGFTASHWFNTLIVGDGSSSTHGWIDFWLKISNYRFTTDETQFTDTLIKDTCDLDYVMVGVRSVNEGQNPICAKLLPHLMLVHQNFTRFVFTDKGSNKQCPLNQVANGLRHVGVEHQLACADIVCRNPNPQGGCL